jgi:hypothetical protein
MNKERDGKLIITIYNVGAGDHMLVRFPNNQHGMVDCGLSSPKAGLPGLQDFLKACDGSQKLRFLCITHPHEDHIAGLIDLVKQESVAIDELWHPMSCQAAMIARYLNGNSASSYEGASEIGEYSRHKHVAMTTLLRLLKSAAVDRKPRLVGLVDTRQGESIGGVLVECLSPSERALGFFLRRIIKDEKSDVEVALREYANRISVVLLLTHGQNRVLLGGDALDGNWREAAARRPAGTLLCDVVKVPHHGSLNSTGRVFWNAFVAPHARLCVSADGVRGPRAEFYLRTDGRALYCTNAGPCTWRGWASAWPIDTHIRPQTCCGNITITLGEGAGDIEVVPEARPIPACMTVPSETVV